MTDTHTTSDDEVRRTIDMLTTLSEDRFAEALADNIMDPDDVETAAFRSPELVTRSEIACAFLSRTQNAHIKEKLVGDDPDVRRKRAATSFFINKVRRERAVLQTIINESNARKGILRNASNPRRRAMERLWQLNLEGDVPKGKIIEVYAEEKEKDAEAKRQAKADARQRAREARQRR